MNTENFHYPKTIYLKQYIFENYSRVGGRLTLKALVEFLFFLFSGTQFSVNITLSTYEVQISDIIFKLKIIIASFIFLNPLNRS